MEKQKKRPPTKGTRKGNGAGGAGWGGAPRGAGNGNERHDFKGAAGPGRGKFSAEGEARAERQARHADEMREILYTVAHDSDAEPNIRIQAADKLLNRIEGLPVSKVLTANTDPVALMSDEQLDAEIEQQRKLIEEHDQMKGADRA